MSLLSDICVRCNKPIKSAVTCDKCNKSFHPSCARDYIKSKVPTDCCRIRLNHLLLPLDSNSTVTRSRVAASRSYYRNSKSKSQTGSRSNLGSPVTPIFPLSPASDSVFYSPISDLIMTNDTSRDLDLNDNTTTSSAIVGDCSKSLETYNMESNPTVVAQSARVLPDGWSNMSTDDRLTILMLSIAAQSQIIAEIPGIRRDFSVMSSKFDDFGKRLDDLQKEHTVAMNEITDLKANAIKNAKDMAKFDSTLATLEEKIAINSGVLASLTSDSPSGSSIVSATNTSSELVISGIPEAVVAALSDKGVVSRIFDELKVPHLVPDVLSIRKLERKSSSSRSRISSTNNKSSIRPVFNTLLLKLKSPQIRDHILELKRKIKLLPVNNIFSTVVGDSCKGNIYINEFLPPALYKLLMVTRAKAKTLDFKFTWAQHGVVFVKKDENSAKIKIVINLVAEIKPHIVALTETWLKPTLNDSLFNLNNYTMFRRDRYLTHPDTGRFLKGGGVACYIHNSLKAKILFTSTSYHINQPEYLILDVVSCTGEHLLLSVIYRRPKDYLLNEFFENLSKLMANYKNLVITSDLNCDLLDTSFVSNHLKNYIAELSLHCVPFEVTHHIVDKNSWLDVVLLDNKIKQKSYFKSLKPFISGHDYLVCDYTFDVSKQVDKLITYRKFSEHSHDALSNLLLGALKFSNDFLHNADPNDLVSIFHTNVLNSLDEFAPVVSHRLSRPSNPWLTRDLKQKCKERDALAKRKELKLELTHARENYLKTALSNLPSGTTVWSKLRHLGLIRNKSSPLSYFDASELNKHFATMVRRHPSCHLEYLDWLSSYRIQIDIVDVTKALQLTLQKSNEAIRQITVDAQSVGDWASENGLEVNLSKTKVMILGSSKNLWLMKQELLSSIVINGTEIPFSESAKCLGLHITNTLSWNLHVSKVLKTEENIYTLDIRRRSDRLAILRNDVNFKIPNFTTTLYEGAFVVTAIRLWQNLPPEIVNASSLDLFNCIASNL
ncbi:Protein of unknown function [Cotesia congregata]|uniref:FP protein C-terminal domain-containing protein n=1 Tax=Cotesia congregata TaxID=51543 RepID=A0A8J2HGB9_COTCN|nr:Protein of unknown function [Cotesia congregata]